MSDYLGLPELNPITPPPLSVLRLAQKLRVHSESRSGVMANAARTPFAEWQIVKGSRCSPQYSTCKTLGRLAELMSAYLAHSGCLPPLPSTQAKSKMHSGDSRSGLMANEARSPLHMLSSAGLSALMSWGLLGLRWRNASMLPAAVWGLPTAATM